MATTIRRETGDMAGTGFLFADVTGKAGGHVTA